MAARFNDPAPPDERPPHSPVPARPPAYHRCITAMVDALHGTDTPTWPATSLRSVALLDAALTSATTGRPAPVAPIPPGQP